MSETTEKIFYSWDYCKTLAEDLAKKIEADVQNNSTCFKVFGIPRGGVNAAQLLCASRDQFVLVEKPEDADIFVDDIIDSGATKASWLYRFPHMKNRFYALCVASKDTWIVFPWESNETGGPEENVRRLIEYIGEDPSREGLLETPKRVLKSYERLFGGYKKDAKSLMKVFEDGACDEMVVLKDIRFYSTCEHHMLPFWGVAHVAYIPNGKVIGVSKMARLVDMFARRMQIQERIGSQVVDALMEHLNAKGAACVIEAQHMCMTARGVENQTAKMRTSALRGVFLENAETRAEFLQMIKGE